MILPKHGVAYSDLWNKTCKTIVKRGKRPSLRSILCVWVQIYRINALELPFITVYNDSYFLNFYEERER